MRSIGVRQRRSRWTQEEDERLRGAVRTYGASRWSDIAKTVGTREKHACYQHWFRVLCPSITKGKFSEDEMRLLTWRVRLFGEHSWCKIGLGLPGRTDTQCRCRWLDIKQQNNPFHRFLVTCVEEYTDEEAAQALGIDRAEEEAKEKLRNSMNAMPTGIGVTDEVQSISSNEERSPEQIEMPMPVMSFNPTYTPLMISNSPYYGGIEWTVAPYPLTADTYAFPWPS